MDPYTAYTDKPSMAQTAADIAVSPHKLSSQLWLYTHMPSLWSTTKGVHIPWNIETGKRVWRGVTTAWGEKRWAVAGLKTLGFASAVKPFGVGGSRLKGQMGTIAENTKMRDMWRGKVEATRMDIRSRYRRIIEMGQERRNRIGVADFHEEFISDAMNMGRGTQQAAVANKARAAANRYRGTATTNIKRNKMMIQRLKGDITEFSKNAWKYQNKITLGHIQRFATRGMKAVSIVGAAMFAWDIARMVGEPVGRAIVGQVDTALNDWEDRFMPELGGRLKMSYLTRGAATERQRALSAMSKAQITGRSGFGREAMYAHS